MFKQLEEPQTTLTLQPGATLPLRDRKSLMLQHVLQKLMTSGKPNKTRREAQKASPPSIIGATERRACRYKSVSIWVASKISVIAKFRRDQMSAETKFRCPSIPQGKVG